MATIKSHTDLPQSKKLAEFLPPESADCYWDYDEMQKFHRISWFEEGYNKDSQLRLNENNVCAWSLAALLDILPYPSLAQHANGLWSLVAWVDKVEAYSVGDSVCGYDNEIDACVAMIEKLHELKML